MGVTAYVICPKFLKAVVMGGQSEFYADRLAELKKIAKFAFANKRKHIV